MRTLVIGDIHGNFKALKQCLELANFNPKTEQLISLGDLVDGYPQSKECVDLLMTFPNFILIESNHDDWFVDWLRTGAQPNIWTSQGGLATLKSFDYTFKSSYLDFFEKRIPWYQLNGKIFVHGGFNPSVPIEEQDPYHLTWDRDLMYYAYDCHNTKSCTIPKPLKKYDTIYVGHTTTENFGSTGPLKLCNVWCLDTGAGWNGRLTIMDIDTEEYWQSDTGLSLYGPNQGKN